LYLTEFGFHNPGNAERRIYITAYRDGAKVVIVAINQRSQAVQQAFLLKDGDVVSLSSKRVFAIITQM
jgi:O-glycosyl hydrolase